MLACWSGGVVRLGWGLRQALPAPLKAGASGAAKRGVGGEALFIRIAANHFVGGYFGFENLLLFWGGANPTIPKAG